MQREQSTSATWVDVCGLDEILPDAGVACLIGGRQIALFRVGSEVFGIDNYDPYSQANVLSRGIVGCRGGKLKVASPMYKQSFCLETGVCFDDPAVTLETFPVRVVGGRVLVRTAATHMLRTRNPELLSERRA
jgi:nitrite reductase (NADH) small subunit